MRYDAERACEVGNTKRMWSRIGQVGIVVGSVWKKLVMEKLKGVLTPVVRSWPTPQSNTWADNVAVSIADMISSSVTMS